LLWGRIVQNLNAKLLRNTGLLRVEKAPPAWRAALKWRRGTILFCMALGLTAGVLALALEHRRHLVSGEVLLPSFKAASDALPGSSSQESFIDAQIETIRSDHVIAASLDKLALWSEFDEPKQSTTPILIADGATNAQTFPRSSPRSDADTLKIISKVKDLLSVAAVASGSAIRVTLASSDPESGAKLVNAILDAYAEDYEKTVRNAPKLVVQELEQRLDKLQERAATAEGQANTQATKGSDRRKLEAVASTYRSLHQQTLNEYSNALNAEPPASAGPRILTRASAARTSPVISSAMLAAALLGGSALGLAFATRREQIMRPVRTPQGIEADTGLPVLGVVSLVHGRKLYPKSSTEPPLLLHDDKDCLRSVLLRTRENIKDGACVVGVASTRDGEGKSTLAFNLAVLGVEGGARVLLLDGNLHRPALARGLSGTAETELLSALRDSSDLVRNVVPTEFGFDFLGEHSVEDHIRPAVLFSSPELDRLIANARKSYDLIICDLPPLADHADAEAAAPCLDVCVLVAAWGSTPTASLTRALKSSPAVSARTSGIVINKAPFTILRPV
jgi:Mrp family chromosome partitioning ATPase